LIVTLGMIHATTSTVTDWMISFLII
jgi:hypothetical protein